MVTLSAPRIFQRKFVVIISLSCVAWTLSLMRTLASSVSVVAVLLSRCVDSFVDENAGFVPEPGRG